MDVRDLERAIVKLDRDIIYPSSFYRLWSEFPSPFEDVPKQEINYPWYENIETYLT